MRDIDETITDVLEVNLKFKNDHGKERNLSFTNFKNPTNPSVDIYADKYNESSTQIKQVKININCDDCNLSISESDGWIPVTERLPECIDGGNVSDLVLCTLYYNDGSNPYVTCSFAWYDRKVPYWQNDNDHCKVVAWQPLPKPYSRK
jgi:hypothetical protein